MARVDLRHAPRLAREFFSRDPITVARQLLGNLLIRRQGRTLLAGRVVETEAYLGLEDPAAHAFNGRTPRNAVLFGPPGHAYVYFIYGNHYCTNVSCHPESNGGGVLLRALEPVAGLAEMAANRDNGKDYTAARSDLWFADDGYRVVNIAVTPRIGINEANKAKDRPLRFLIAGNRSVSVLPKS